VFRGSLGILVENLGGGVMRTRVGIVVLAGISMAMLTGCTQNITEPLSSSQLRDVLRQIDKPDAWTKLSSETVTDFEEAYGDQERIDPTFENASDECSAVADLDRVSRFAQGGLDYRKFMPSALRGFNDVDGKAWSIETPDSADSYSYAQIELAIMTFDDSEAAVSYSSTISGNVEECFDFRESGEGSLQTYELSDFSVSEEHEPDFSYEYTDFWEIEFSDFDITLVSDHWISVMHFGPNVAVLHIFSDDDSRAELGVTTTDLADGTSELRESIESAIRDVQDGEPSDAQ
jgi:hypothetical protein